MTKIKGFYCLNKSEIVRGYNSFKDILVDSKIIYNNFLKLNIRFKKDNIVNKDFQNIKDPLQSVKVGFVVSKRVVKKSSFRNKLKRLLRESYRLNKHILDNIVYKDVCILFGYNDSHKKDFVNLDMQLVNANMKMILEKTLDFLNKQK